MEYNAIYAAKTLQKVLNASRVGAEMASSRNNEAILAMPEQNL